MKHTPGLAGVVLLLFGTGCNITINSNEGPTKTDEQEIDAGKAETVRAEIRMGAGDFHLQGGGTKLMSGSFRYSDSVGPPAVRYDVTNSRGLLSVESKKNSLNGKMVNDWNLRMGSQTPLEMNLHLGGGDATLDVSTLPLRSIEIETGAGDLKLNLAGKYATDVTALVKAGAGDTEIRLPKDMGAVVDARIGVGDIEPQGMTKRADGKYYNEAYAEGKPAVRLDVRGGVGDLKLTVGQ